MKTRDILEKKIDSVRDGVEAKTINNEDNKNGDDNPIAEPHFRLRCTGCLMSSVQLTPTSSCLCVNCSDPIECLRQRIGAFDLLHQAYLRKIELNQHLQRIATQCAVNDVSSRSGKMKQNNTKSPEITRAPGSKISVTESPAPGDRTLSSPSPVPVKNIHVESLCLDCNDYACVGASLHVRMLPYAERTRMKEIKMKEGKHAPKVVGYKIFPERYEDGAR